jgi:hypothetical protein
MQPLAEGVCNTTAAAAANWHLQEQAVLWPPATASTAYNTHNISAIQPFCRDVHREEKICGLGSEVVNTWFKGIAMGPDAARVALEADIDAAVQYRSHQVLRHHKGQVRCCRC